MDELVSRVMVVLLLGYGVGVGWGLELSKTGDFHYWQKSIIFFFPTTSWVKPDTKYACAEKGLKQSSSQKFFT